MSFSSKFKTIAVSAALLFGAVTTIGLSSSQTVHAATVPHGILDSGLDASVPTSGEKIDGKYSFIAKFIPGKTKLYPLGKAHTAAYRKVTASYKGMDLNLASKEAVKGEVGALYTNVGFIKGKPVDLTLTVTDWVKFSDIGLKPDANNDMDITFSDEGIEWTNHGADFNVQFNYYWHGTKDLVTDDMAGYMTFYDVDWGQATYFSAATSNTIGHKYVPRSDTNISAKKVNDRLALYEARGIGADWRTPSQMKGEVDSSQATVTMLSNDMNQMQFTWLTGHAESDNSDPQNLLLNDKINAMGWSVKTDPTDYVTDITQPDIVITDAGAALGYSATKPLPTETVPPTKTVSDDDEKLANKDILDKLSEPIVYDVQQNIPSETSAFFYTSAEMKDTIPALLKVDSVKIIDEAGNDRTSFFTNKSSGNTLDYVATDSALKNSSFYGHVYDWKITTHIDLTKDLSKYVQEGIISFDNNATFNIDDDSKTSNTVNTTVNALGKINISKQDLDLTSKKLAGAQFSLYKTKADATSGSNAIKTITTDSNGNGVFTDLSLVDSTKGTYYLKEVKAPSGYQLDSTVREVKAVEDSAGVKINNVNDEQKINIPATGSKKNAAFTSAGIISAIGLVLVLAGFGFSKQRKQNDQ